jgi:hypothetical protein
LEYAAALTGREDPRDYHSKGGFGDAYSSVFRFGFFKLVPGVLASLPNCGRFDLVAVST